MRRCLAALTVFCAAINDGALQGSAANKPIEFSGNVAQARPTVWNNARP